MQYSIRRKGHGPSHPAADAASLGVPILKACESLVNGSRERPHHPITRCEGSSEEVAKLSDLVCVGSEV